MKRTIKTPLENDLRLSLASEVAVVVLATALAWAPSQAGQGPESLKGDQSPAEILAQAAGKIEPDDPTRPAYHCLPAGNWMNDICGTIHHDGWYHLFYLQNPFKDCFSRFVVWGHARSRDLVHWQRLELTLPPSLDNRQMRYFVGPFEPDTCRFEVETQGVLDHSYGREHHWVARGFYASNVLVAPDGRRILFGWVAGFHDRKGNFHGKPGDRPGRGWNGCVSLPRLVTLGKDGLPRQHPVKELKVLRGAWPSFPKAVERP